MRAMFFLSISRTDLATGLSGPGVLPLPRRKRTSSREESFGFIRGHDNSRPDGFATSFAGADANAIVERQDEDFAVADLAGLGGAGGVDDGLDGRLDERFVDGNFQLELGQEANLELGAAVDFGIAALTA